MSLKKIQNQIKGSGKKLPPLKKLWKKQTLNKNIYKQIGSLKWNFRLHLSDRGVIMLFFSCCCYFCWYRDANDVISFCCWFTYTYTHGPPHIQSKCFTTFDLWSKVSRSLLLLSLLSQLKKIEKTPFLSFSLSLSP